MRINDALKLLRKCNDNLESVSLALAPNTLIDPRTDPPTRTDVWDVVDIFNHPYTTDPDADDSEWLYGRGKTPVEAIEAAVRRLFPDMLYGEPMYDRMPAERRPNAS